MRTKLHFITLLLCLWQVALVAQVTIAIQDFEVAPATPTFLYTSTGGALGAGVGTAPATNMFLNARSYQVRNTTGTVTFDAISTAAYSGISLHLRLASFSSGSTGNGADAGDNVRVEISNDGVTYSNEYRINGNNNARWDFSATGVANTVYDGDNLPFISTATAGTSTTGISTINITGLPSTTTLHVRVTILNDTGNELWALDNVELRGTPVVSCPHTVSTFTPITGTQGTEVTIVGSGFTGSSTVFFNGIAASSVVFVNSTTLVATVPAGATTGVITVTEAACDVFSGPTFTLIEQSGVCNTLLSNIIISEVYDKSTTSLGYIELYNGTGATVDLTLYRIDRFGDIADISPTHAYTFPAGTTIAHGQVLFGRISIDPNESGVTPNFTFTGTNAGFNENDKLELVLISSGAVIDDFHDALVGVTGYVYRRNTTIAAPNPAFNSSEWTTAASGTTSNLGIYSFPVGGGAPTISTQPTDISSCAANFSISATAGSGGALTYQWFFNENNGVATGWTTVTGGAFPGTTVLGATSNSLSITGNLLAYDNYQFYCQVTESGTCNVPSEAVQFTLDADRFFRSLGTGNWDNATTWEMATSAAGPWTPACVFPMFSNSDYIHIMSGHVVTVAADVTLDQVVVEAGGTISINSNSEIFFNNGTGIDLDVQGTFIDNGTSGNGVDFGSATWVLGTNGEIIKTAGSPVAQYRDNYNGGIATIPATATWRFRFVGSSNVPIVTIGMFYPNLYFESTSGNHTFSAATEMFTGNSGFTTIKGNFYVGNTGTGTVDVFTTNTHATPLQVLGDLVVGGNAAVGTSKLENNDGTTIGTGIEIFGNVIINNNGLLDFQDGTAAADGALIVHGNWTDLNTGTGFDQGESTVTFNGSALQTINKVSGNENFYNVIVSKPSGNIQNNANNMVIKNNMTFTSGLVLTTSSSYLVFEPVATATTASNASHTDGPVIKQTNNGTVTTFTYPTGDNGIYGAIGIETRFFNGESFDAEYFNAGYGAYNVNTLELDHVSHFEYWLLNDINALGENLKVTLHWGTHSKVITPASIRVAHFYTEAPSLANQWEREGAAPVITGTAATGTVTSDTYVTTFSPFTLADIIRQESLPLDLLRFEATKVKRTSELYWQVANEFAGDRYCVQRSDNGYTFETLYCVDATQNNPIKAYNYTDNSPLLGVNYYRIHQIDVAGAHDYSFIRSVTFDDSNVGITIFPNPANNAITVQVPPLKDAAYTIEIIDVLGRILSTQQIAAGKFATQVDVTSLAAGSYLIRVQGNNGVFGVETITVQH